MTAIPRDYWVQRFATPRLPQDPHKSAVGLDSGEQGFVVGRLNMGYLAMWRATKDPQYLARARRNLDATVAAMHASSFTRYPAGTPFLISTNYTTDHSPSPWLVHDGYVLSAMADFVLASLLPDFPPELQASATGYRVVLDLYRHRWDSEWRPLPNGRGCYVMPTWQTHYAGIGPGQSLAFNMSEAWAVFLYRYSKLTGDADAKAKAVAVGWTLKDNIHHRGSGSVWHYAETLVPQDSNNRYKGGPWSDSNHASTEAWFMDELARDNLVFTSGDMARVAYQFNHVIYAGGSGPTRHWMDGTGSRDGTEVDGYGVLARTDATAPTTLKALLDSPSQPFGSSRMAIGLLAEYAQ